MIEYFARWEMATREFFGKYNGKTVEKLTLKDKIVVEIVTFGATIVAVKAPSLSGETVDVALGYSTVEQLLCSSAHMGGTIGRCANRIADGRFTLDGVAYSLEKNDNGVNHLHGGTGFDRRLFTVKSATENSAELCYHSQSGEENYPAALDFSVKFTVQGAMLRIEYFARADGTTLFNPTNHAYFNLDGQGSADVYQNELQIFADKFLPVDKNLIPTGEERQVFGTPFDFSQPKAIGKDIFCKDEQLALAGGYDHNFCLCGQHAARASSAKTGIVMDVYTDRVGLQFYSGNFLNGEKGKAVYNKRAGFCLETQFYPNAVNVGKWAQPVIRKGEQLHSKTEYVFSTKDSRQK